MHTLTDYVTIKGYSTEPGSGQYLNQLPGISLESVQRIANSEQVTFVQVFNDVQERAWRRLMTDIRNRMRQRFKIKTNKTLFRLSTHNENATIAAGAKYRGLVLNSGVDDNGFFAYYLTSVTIDLPGAHASLAIKVIDRFGAVLDTLTITNAVQGLNTVAVNKSYPTSRLFIAVNASAVDLSTTYLVTDEVSEFRAYMGSIYSFKGEAYGGESSLTTPDFISTYSANTYGISAVVMPTCDYSAIVAQDKAVFLTAWMNLLGAELMIERIYSSRINKLTTVDEGKAESLRDLYTGLYENALDDTVDGIQISSEDGCIECRQMVETVETLP